MIGYKCTDMNGCCRGFKFEVGKTYKKDTPKEELECCTNKVFHFCRELSAIEKESGYKLSKSRIFEVIAGDFVRSGDKYGKNELTILREIEGEEKQSLINSGSHNSGWYNSGNYNSGWYNSGSHNSGNYNSGSHNSGSHNSGNYNSGWYNSGWYNSGWYNSGNYNSGFFNSDEPYVRMFNKMTKKKMNEINIPSWCNLNLTVWVSHDTATEKEKEEHKTEIKTSGGFLKTLDYKEAWRVAWDKASKEEHKELLKLPNWNNKVFEEITGIDAESEIASEAEE